MRKAALLISVLAFAFPMQAGVITLAECTARLVDSSEIVHRSASACGIDRLPSSSVYGDDDIQATVQGELSLRPDEPYGASLHGGGFAFVQAFSQVDGGENEESWLGAAYVDISLVGITEGPARPGLIEVAFAFGGGANNGTTIGSWRVGHISGDVFTQNVMEPECSGPFAFDECMMEPTLFSFTLGTLFGAELHLAAFSGTSRISPAENTTDLRLDFRLLELDGTPVRLSSVPEPGSLGLLVGGLVAMILWHFGMQGRRHRR